VVISRTHPDFIRKLFELEIPEIAEGIIEIKAISRDPGRRAKMAVISHDKNVGAVGTCIGHMGARIQNVTKELGNERIDVIEWNDNPEIYISHAISPAKPSFIRTDSETQSAIVVVAEDQQALAIGKEGQNVRLASKLTGWKLDIISEKMAEEKGIKNEKKKKTESAEGIKISALAKELGIKSRELIEKLKSEGIEVKTSASLIDEKTKKLIVSKLAEK
jgi:N utilization substance protein A